MASPPDRREESGRREESVFSDDLGAWLVRHGPALRRFFARRAGAAEAEDLVQEVFLRLQSRADAEPVRNVEGYLFKVAKHVLVSRHRHDRARGGFLGEPFDELSAGADELSPERILLGRQEYERIVVAILNLPPRARTAFQLHRFDHMTYAAIARRMGISKDSVKELMQRAIDRLCDATMEEER